MDAVLRQAIEKSGSALIRDRFAALLRLCLFDTGIGRIDTVLCMRLVVQEQKTGQADQGEKSEIHNGIFGFPESVPRQRFAWHLPRYVDGRMQGTGSEEAWFLSRSERRPESGRGAAGFRQSLIARHASITASDNANLHINSVQTLFLRKCIRKSCAAWLSKAGKRVAAAYSNPWFPEDTVTTQPRSSRIQSNGRLRSCFKPKSVIRHAVSVSDGENEAFGHLARFCPHPASRYAST